MYATRENGAGYSCGVSSVNSLSCSPRVFDSLGRYQHRIEWFHRDRLRRVWDDNTARGEKALALDFYEHLYEQGIEFYIEPYSVSGEST